MKRITKTLRLIAIAFTEQVRAERAYLGNFWFGMLTKLAYNSMFLLFINQLYHRVGQLGDFTKNEFLFLFLVSQLGFYICFYGLYFPLKKLLITVRTGNFDLMLLKPVPHRAFLYISGMSAFELLLTALPSLLILGGIINWGEIHISLFSFLMGLVIWVSGIVICNTILFALVLPVFSQGDATDTLDLFYPISSVGQQPFSKLPQAMKIAALVIFPQILIAGAASETLLMKQQGFLVPLVVAGTAIIAVIILQLLWRHALRNYTSASS